jgi:predicted Fe-Mo cluster-binding NifX family protein
MKVLLDASVDPTTRETIERVLINDPLVARVRALSARNAGRYVFLEAILEVRTDDLAQAHAASERLEESVRAAVPQVDHVTLHLEPPRRELVTVAVPLDAAGTLSSGFGSAAVFRFSRIRARDGAMMAEEDVANPHTAVERQKGLLVAEWLVRRGVDVLLTRQTPRKGPAYVLRDGAVQIRLAHTGDVAAELARL